MSNLFLAFLSAISATVIALIGVGAYLVMIKHFPMFALPSEMTAVLAIMTTVNMLFIYPWVRAWRNERKAKESAEDDLTSEFIGA